MAQQSGPLASGNRLELSLDENAAPGTVVETLSARFENLENFRVIGDADEQLLDVDLQSGAIIVRDGAVFDFESRSLHSLTVQADVKLRKDDQFFEEFAQAISDDGLSAAQLKTILPSERTISVRFRLRNVHETPQMDAAAFSIPENSSKGQFVGQMSAIDPDGPAKLRYSIVNDNAASPFAIDPATGTLTVRQTELLDFELASEITLTIRVTDQDGLSADSPVQVQLTDIDERPVISDEAVALTVGGPQSALDWGLVPLPVDIPVAGEPIVSNLVQVTPQSASISSTVVPHSPTTSAQSMDTKTIELATADSDAPCPKFTLACHGVVAGDYCNWVRCTDNSECSSNEARSRSDRAC